MRPYMQWLARVYAGRPVLGYTGSPAARAALEDWITYQHDQRVQVREALRWLIAGSAT